MRGSCSTKMVITQLWNVIFRHAIYHQNAGNVLHTFNSIMLRYSAILTKDNVRNTRSKFLHSTFLNKDFSFNIVCRSIKFLTVIFLSVVEGSVSHFFYIGLRCLFMLFRKQINIIFYNILHFIS